MYKGGEDLLTDSKCFLRPILITADPRLRTAILDVLALRLPTSAVTVLTDDPDPAIALQQAQAANTNLCLVDVNGSSDRQLTLLRERAAAGLTAVALHGGDDSGLILRCVRSGAHEFLSAPFHAETVWQILDDLTARRRTPDLEARGSVCLVLPAKPNLGSTTVATNLALRAQSLLADLDPLYSSLRFQLKINSKYTFLDAFSNWEKIDSALWCDLVVEYLGIRVLLAPEGRGNCQFQAPAPAEFLHLLRNHNPSTYVDCPGLLTDWYIQLAEAADQVILVATNELTAVHAAKRALATLESAGRPASKIKLVINRYEPERGLTVDAIETALRTKVFHTLPNDYEAVQKAIFDGKPIASNTRLGKGLNSLHEALFHHPAKAKSARPWSTLFARARPA